ncbi:MAG TPA: hypothetical protein VGH22_24255 [Candidatus Binatia bacterium]|jgi:hypothetical protein
MIGETAVTESRPWLGNAGMFRVSAQTGPNAPVYGILYILKYPAAKPYAAEFLYLTDAL